VPDAFVCLFGFNLERPNLVRCF